MIEKYLNDYYTKKIGVKEICEELKISPTTFRRRLEELGLPNRMNVMNNLNTGDKDLDKSLKIKYSSMTNRCRGMSTDKYGHYNGLDYMDVFEYVELCNSNRGKLLTMWNKYIESGKQLKYSISIDRLDNSLGYTNKNIQFVPHGYNSWKRGVIPISVNHDGITSYFMSSEEGSRFYGLRKQAINECLRKIPYHLRGYKTEYSTIEDVLYFARVDSLREYYDKFIDI